MFDPGFCGHSNISTCFQLLVSELEVLNIPVIEYEEGNNNAIVYLLNVTWSLVTNRKIQALRINEQNEIILNFKAKLSHLEDTNKKNLILLENETKQLLLSRDSLINEKSAKDKILSEIGDLKKEIKFLQGTLSKQQLQFEHDIRRKNCVIENLQRKLFKLLGPDSQKTSERCISKNTRDVSIIEENKLSRQCLSSLQNNIQLLLMENVNLRNSLLKIYASKKNLIDDTTEEQQEILLKLPYQELLNKIEEDIIARIS